MSTEQIISGKVIEVGGDPCKVQLQVIGGAMIRFETSKDWGVKIVKHIYEVITLVGEVETDSKLKITSFKILKLIANDLR